jgi:phage major head subunit gpT-like protein
MKLTRDNFQQLLTPIHLKIIHNAYNEKPEQFPKAFKVITMRKKTETIPHMGGFGMWDSNTEGNTINEDEMNEGPVATFEAERFDKGYSVTWELTKDDLYGVMTGKGVKGDAKNLGAGLRRTKETRAAAVINNGFANVGYDGKALFAADHPLVDSADVLDNLMTGGLTPANVKLGMTKMRNQVDEAGNKIQAVARQLIVGPDLEFTAKEIVKSTNQAFELSNTKNSIEGLDPVIMDYIEGAKWALRDPSFDNLAFLVREKEWFDSQQLPKTVDFFVFGYARWDEGYYDVRGLVGSQGA